MKKKIEIVVLSTSIIFICILIAAFLVIRKSGSKTINPVIVIGLDGADWNIIRPLLREGKLPHIGSLVSEGSSGILKTFRPTKSPVVWTSIATGKTMMKHGVLDWAYVEKNKIHIPYSVEDRKVKAIWKILSEKNYSVGVINWFCTFPAEEVNGFMISDRFRVSVDKELKEEGVTYPTELNELIFPKAIPVMGRTYKKLLRENGLEDYLMKSQDMNIDIPSDRKRQVRFFRRYFLQDKSIENISFFLLENIPVDFFAAYFRLIDTTSHFASMFIESKLREKWIQENEELGGPSLETERLLYENMVSVIEPVYVYLDSVIGGIISKAPLNATFILVSDHGFNFSQKGYNHYDVPKIPHGIIILKGPGIKKAHTIFGSKVFDIVPTILYLYGLPSGEDMDGEVILDAFEDDFKQKRQIKLIATYEGTVEKGRKARKKRKALDKEMIEDLKTLGYIK